VILRVLLNVLLDPLDFALQLECEGEGLEASSGHLRFLLRALSDRDPLISLL